MTTLTMQPILCFNSYNAVLRLVYSYIPTSSEIKPYKPKLAIYVDVYTGPKTMMLLWKLCKTIEVFNLAPTGGMRRLEA